MKLLTRYLSIITIGLLALLSTVFVTAPANAGTAVPAVTVSASTSTDAPAAPSSHNSVARGGFAASQF